MVTLRSHNFNGMIYPKGLATNSTCMVEYKHVDSVTYLLPLRACNTMSADVVSPLPSPSLSSHQLPLSCRRFFSLSLPLPLSSPLAPRDSSRSSF